MKRMHWSCLARAAGVSAALAGALIGGAVLTAAPVPAHAVQAAVDVEGPLSGELTDTMSWSCDLNEDGSTYTLRIKGSGDMPEFEKVGSYRDTPWRHIDSEVKKNITLIDIGEDITSISDEALNYSTIPFTGGEGLVSVGYWSMPGAYYQTEINLPRLEHVGEYAFYQTTNQLRVINLPSVKTIGAHAFDGLAPSDETPKPITITLSDSIESVGKSAFCGRGIVNDDFVQSLFDQLKDIPEGMLYGTFYNKATLPASVESVAGDGSLGNPSVLHVEGSVPRYVAPTESQVHLSVLGEYDPSCLEEDGTYGRKYSKCRIDFTQISDFTDEQWSVAMTRFCPKVEEGVFKYAGIRYFSSDQAAKHDLRGGGLNVFVGDPAVTSDFSGVLGTPELFNFQLDGWYTSQDLTEDSKVADPASVDWPTSNDAASYYAKWSAKLYDLADYRSGAQDTWTHPACPDDLAFTGWFRDVAYKEPYGSVDVDYKDPCGPADVTGKAYARFTPVSELARFAGGQLRMDQAADKATSLRFRYEVTLPEGLALNTTGKTGWAYRVEGQDLRYALFPSALNTSEETDRVVTNLVVTNLPVKMYGTSIFSTFTLGYTTADGTAVSVGYGEESRSVEQVARGAVASDNEQDKAYGQKILDAMGAAGAQA